MIRLNLREFLRIGTLEGSITNAFLHCNKNRKGIEQKEIKVKKRAINKLDLRTLAKQLKKEIVSDKKEFSK